MRQKIIFLIIAVFVGYMFYSFNIPAGWLIGALITGITYGIFIKQLQFDGYPFRIALAFIGANIGIMLQSNVLKQVHYLILPLLLTIVIMMTSGFLSGHFLQKRSNLNKKTAFFCTIPGGASEIIGLSGEYGADHRIVAAFHTVRITIFSLSIPLLIGYLNRAGHGSTVEIAQENESFSMLHVVFFLTVITITLLIEKYYHIPGGTLIFSIILGFVLSEYITPIESVPRYISGMGQAAIGAFVGIRFDRKVLNEIVKIGPITLIIVGAFVTLSFLTSSLFMVLTGLPFTTSLLGTVPAGAPEMSVTAVALNIDPTIIASLHIVRVIFTFLFLPILMKMFTLLHKKEKL